MQKRALAIAGAPARAAFYPRPAPLREVLFEQLDYLLTHHTGRCPVKCSECARLEEIQFRLLEPFRVGG